MTNVKRSPLFYVGDKYKLVPSLLSIFPSDIDRFIEPFVGGGSVSLNVDAQTYLLNDINGKIIDIHKMLCSYIGREDEFFREAYQIIDEYGLSCSLRYDNIPEAFKKQYVKTYYAQYNKEPFNRLREYYNKGEASTLVLYLLLIYGFNRMLRFNNKGQYNLPVGNVDFNHNTEQALKEYFNVMREKEIQWFSFDFREFFRCIKICKSDFVYLDPPYLITFSEYNKLWNDEAESDLLDILDSLKCRFAISNVTHYKGRVNERFLDWSQRYNVHPIKSNYISYHDNSIKSFNEVIVTNY